MAVVKMDRLTVYGLKKNRKKILETLQRLGVVEVCETKAEEGFAPLDTTKSRGIFEKTIHTAEEALEILHRYAHEEKSLFAMLEGKDRLSYSSYEERLPGVDRILSVAKEILQKEKEKEEHLAEIQRRENILLSLQDWKALDVPMTYSGTAKVGALIGLFPEEISTEGILTQFAEQWTEGEEVPPLDVEILSHSREQTCVILFCPKTDQEVVEQKLRNFGFSRPSVFTSMIPAERIERHQKKIAAYREAILQCEDTIRSLANQREDLHFFVDYYCTRLEKYQTLEKVLQGKRVFCLSGYLPHESADMVREELFQRGDAAVEIEPAGDEDDVPVLLKNNAFAAPTETVLETYSMPGRGEVDPTGVMAIFYYVLFGLMLSDAAYGFLMVLACGILLWRFKEMKSGLRKSLTMFFYCGISTTFWGVMFGSYFGDAITVISDNFFHHPVTIPPLWFTPVDEPMRMLVFSMALGIIHLFAGLAIRFYSCIRAKDYLSAIVDVLCWYFVVGGAVVFLLSTPMFVGMVSLSFILPPLVGKIALIFVLIGSLGIIFFAGRSSKNPGKRVAKGLYELYGVTSYLSDILSYSRLLALGLATGVIAEVFNKMGSMFGDGVLGIILFALVFLIGHTLNIAINLLGAYVHTNRLQFVEFFGKFYEGGGRKFTPFAMNTKYYQFEEEKK